MHNPHVAAMLFDTPLLVHPLKLKAVLHGLGERFGVEVPAAPPQFSRTAGNEIGPQAFRAAPTAEWSDNGYYVDGGVAVIDVFGALVQRAGWIDAASGVQSYDRLAERFTAAVNDNRVGAILLNIDSPGGQVGGVFDLADEIHAARGSKPIVAQAADLAASAAYLLASAADEVVATRTAFAGSIGVVMAHFDYSRAADKAGVRIEHIYAGARKVDGTPWLPLSEEARDRFQADIDALYGLFTDTVARNRAMALKRVIDTQAATYLGEQGVGAGLVDRIASARETLLRLQQSASRSAGRILFSSATPMATEETHTMPEATESTSTEATAGTVLVAQEGVVDTTAAEASARADERRRIATILESEAAAGRMQAAIALATGTDMAAEAAIATLGKLPALAIGATPLERAMAAAPQPGIAAEGEPAEPSAVTRILGNYQRATTRA